MRKVTLFLLFCIVCLSPSYGKAKPILISFAEMMEQAETIIVARYQGMSDGGVFGPYLLEVSEVIKGNVNTITIEASLGTGQVDFPIGTECIAFLKQDNSFEWVATIAKEESKRIDEALLFVRGFYDFNAYLVYPSCMTLHQIKNYIETSNLNYQFEGDLYFFSDKSQQMEKSNISFSVNYTYQKDTSYWEVDSKNITIIDFPKIPEVSLSAWETILTLEYESSLNRPLVIEGQILSKEDNIFQVLFWVEAPEEITYKDFKNYLQKPEWGHVYYELELEHDEKTYPFIYHQEIGRIGNLEGFENSVLSCQSLSREALEFSLGDNTDLVIKFDVEELDKDFGEYSSDDFIRALRLNNFKGRILKVRNGQIIKDLGDCELSFKNFHFVVK